MLLTSVIFRICFRIHEIFIKPFFSPDKMSYQILLQNVTHRLATTNLKNALFSLENIHTTSASFGKINRMRDRKSLMRTVTKKEDGTRGEKSIDVDGLLTSEKQFQRFPDIDLPNQLFNNVPFKDLPICHIRVTKNNTIVDTTDGKGNMIFLNSCGKEGYKNCRKGTNIAAQATAVTISKQCLERGIDTIKVMVRGLGPGRMAAIKGLQMGGLNIVSITDATRVSDNPPRPRKARRV